MPKQAATSAPPPDDNGWIKGVPAIEGSFWYCTKDNKYNDWRTYLGSSFEFRGELSHSLTGYGTVRSEELKHCYYQPASIPELPVAVLEKRAKKTSAA